MKDTDDIWNSHMGTNTTRINFKLPVVTDLGISLLLPALHQYGTALHCLQTSKLYAAWMKMDSLDPMQVSKIGARSKRKGARWVTRGVFSFPGHSMAVRSLSLASLHFLGHLSTCAREAQTGLPPLLLPFSLSQSPPGASYYPNWTEARRNKEPEEGKEALPPSLMATLRHSINRRRTTTGFLLARDTKQMSQGPWRVMCITEAIISGGECGQAENSLQLRWSDLFFFF